MLELLHQIPLMVESLSRGDTRLFPRVRYALTICDAMPSPHETPSNVQACVLPPGAAFVPWSNQPAAASYQHAL